MTQINIDWPVVRNADPDLGQSVSELLGIHACESITLYELGSKRCVVVVDRPDVVPSGAQIETAERVLLMRISAGVELSIEVWP